MLYAEINRNSTANQVQVRAVGYPEDMAKDILCLVNSLFCDIQKQDKTLADYFRLSMLDGIQPNSPIWHVDMREGVTTGRKV